MSDKRIDEFAVLDPDTAGIDVGAGFHCVSVPVDRDPEPVQSFSALTHGLVALADWLSRCRIRKVAMESTGVYWIALFELLSERGFDVVLVDARRVKNVSGRKSDPSDCRWLRRLHSCGLLQCAFRPPQDVCAVRAIVRHRARLIEDSGRYVQRMQKALTEMNLKLDRVLSDIAGSTGLAILRAIVAGERDPKVLAEWRDRRCGHSLEEIEQALTGSWRNEHLYVLGQALASFDHFQQQIHACDDEIERLLARWQSKPARPLAPARRRSTHRNAVHTDLRAEMHRTLGVDVTTMPGMEAYSALRIVSEVGPDLRVFKSAAQFACWLGLCPGTKISGGKVLSGKTAKVANRAARAFRLAAQSVGRTQTALGAFYRRMRSRLGAPKALTATAHKMARQFYAMVTQGLDYTELGVHAYEQQYRDRLLRNLTRQAQALGFELTPQSG